MCYIEGELKWKGRLSKTSSCSEIESPAMNDGARVIQRSSGMPRDHGSGFIRAWERSSMHLAIWSYGGFIRLSGSGAHEW